MSERTQLLKKAVLTSVGATSSVDKIKLALKEAVDDLVKVGQDLLEELEATGRTKADNMQNFLINLQDEATRRTGEVGTRVQTSVVKAAKDFGLATHEEIEEILERLEALEKATGQIPKAAGKSRKTKSSRSDS